MDFVFLHSKVLFFNTSVNHPRCEVRKADGRQTPVCQGWSGAERRDRSQDQNYHYKRDRLVKMSGYGFAPKKENL